jgi:hypothetical protein
MITQPHQTFNPPKSESIRIVSTEYRVAFCPLSNIDHLLFLVLEFMINKPQLQIVLLIEE